MATTKIYQPFVNTIQNTNSHKNFVKINAKKQCTEIISKKKAVEIAAHRAYNRKNVIIYMENL